MNYCVPTGESDSTTPVAGRGSETAVPTVAL